ncbi:MAG: hypothetical protein FWD22_06970, partial [Treponema sp.]|nr:hypothetical protein [Treponema sp.]
MSKKIIPVIFLVLILFAGIIALTQELDFFLPDIDLDEIEFSDDFEPEQELPEWVKPLRWFRSNAGGMALEEMQSRFPALRNKYALAINFVHRDELPEYLNQYYEEGYFLEVRMLYKDGEQIRTQWIFRDDNGNTRLNAVFMEPDSESVPEDEYLTTYE